MALSLKQHEHVEPSSQQHSLSVCPAGEDCNMGENLVIEHVIRKVEFRELKFFP